MLTDKLKIYLQRYHEADLIEDKNIMAHQLVPIAEFLISNIEDELETEYMIGYSDGLDETPDADELDSATYNSVFYDGYSVGVNEAGVITPSDQAELMSWIAAPYKWEMMFDQAVEDRMGDQAEKAYKLGYSSGNANGKAEGYENVIQFLDITYNMMLTSLNDFDASARDKIEVVLKTIESIKYGVDVLADA